jgi:hypothetical protein
MSAFFIVSTIELEFLISCVVKGCYGVSEKTFKRLWPQFRDIAEGDRVFLRLKDEVVCGPLIVSSLSSNIRYLQKSRLWGKVNDQTTPVEYLPTWISFFPWCLFFDATLTPQVNYCRLGILQANHFNLQRMGIINPEVGEKLWEFIDAYGSSFADFIQRMEPSTRLRQPFQNTQRTISGRIKSKRGVLVRSKSERLIDDWLYDHNYRAEYERCVTLGGYVIAPDFYLPDIDLFIEHLGLLESSEDYRKDWSWKKELYEKHKMKYEVVTEADINDLDRVLNIKLKKYQK